MVSWNKALIREHGGPGPRYTSYPPAPSFHSGIAEEDFWQAMDEGNAARRPLSLYIHIPFCGSVCYYCACNRIITANKARSADYLRLLKQEIQRKAVHVDSRRPVTQMHWGGGTPTFLDDGQLTELVYDLARHFNLRDDERSDYAIEIDPRTVDQSRLGLLRGLGFNRVSLGVQDLDPRVQKAVNRVQPYELIRDTMEWSRDFGFRSINTDLIYGLPWQSESSLARTLEQLLTLRPDRISLYNYAHLPERFKIQRQIQEHALPDPEEKLNMLTRAGKMLNEQGYRYIGMDHFALENDSLSIAQENGLLHRNFQGYTLHGDADLLGLGVSAISQIGNLYAQNHKALDDWQTSLEDRILPIEKGFMLNRDDQIRRALIIQLLCDLSVDMLQFGDTWGINFADYFVDALTEWLTFEAQGLVTVENDRLFITETGRLVSRALVMPFDRYTQREQRTRFSRII
ncbi:MAG: coproporphyrinogen III oxidase [Alcanivorax borkumensis]|jgi:oxygen-independent coproporphyrinogen-3 oxidase|uniref:Coproporphyrinogen-III oxidase n=1 Tax=Alcanivorax borkumensis (strain ATCC 700651 / DSM 11573 / NCIMB 13689 / SK2) TaxID=393595 RepID=Q0VPV8_ALCBS|nr:MULTISPECIES: oxygen-independent coproporphyrinogen III oxidase [Alcanivorax]OJH07722.1 MAG: coproporphyrinogen III oxidase [Alcanivorax borkumensis]EUC71221.1 coproporphyrinogen III oxidase [Alcanivorax sp. 97CO-5]PKG02654.1 oxygen-independent coproporphyrinogen III oxidase [Alcanivorax sp. 97CO-6]CAL16790.1 coproporphyrinogen oxidase [Alcanivorax borkumensis SK2]BAP14266.1 coproporphyrinogen III oxidase [Alcanivorax sp. NBRC 101098]